MIAITILAAWLRLFNLSTNPPSVFSDELIPWEGTFNYLIGAGPYYVYPKPIVSIAQGILFGQFVSLYFAGTTTLAIRLPGAIYGIALVPLTYSLVRKWLGIDIAIISSFLVAINPLSIMDSRVFYMQQSADAVFIMVLATYLFWMGCLERRFRPFYILISYNLFFLIIFGYFNAKGVLDAFCILLLLIIFGVMKTRTILRPFDILTYFAIVPIGFGFFLHSGINLVFGQYTSTQAAIDYIGNTNILTHGLSGIREFFFRYPIQNR
ncbi:MAG: hypothetical protein JRN15_21330 [Nitrososphaerota archaeon]|nr:hypothetical protein [Nitrososphaerota archaeon]